MLACFGLSCCVGCHVYDASRLDEPLERGAIRGTIGERGDAAIAEDAEFTADASTSCGDGVVDGGERCDIAIPRGKPGACPDGCSGGVGCMRRELEGHGCDARCVEREATQPLSGDGCCPEGTDYYADDDCAPRCGNGELEPGESCDPAETCPREAACKKTEACISARFLGSADSCNARCDRTPITSCLSADGCCPAGCDRARDSDCPPTCPGSPSCPSEVTPMPIPTPEEPASEPPPFECSQQHPGTACRACDCEHCGTQIAACLTGQAEDARLCGLAIDCSERAHCVGDACYCGDITADSCTTMPQGACQLEWEEAARTTNSRLVRLAAAATWTTLGKAMAVIECRAQHCAAACDL